MEYVFAILHHEELAKIPKSEPEKRLGEIIRLLFNYVYEKISQGLFLNHQQLFAMRLAQIRVHGDSKYDEVFELLLNSPAIFESKINPSILDGKLSKSQLKNLEGISVNKNFDGLIEKIEGNEEKWI